MIFGLWFAHEFLGVKLPIMRTGMYLLFFVSIAAVCPAVDTWTTIPTGASAWRLSPIFILISYCYARQWTPRATWDWRYDASTREFAKTIDILGIDAGLHNIKVGGSWVFEPALNYYREKNSYSNWLPVVRQSHRSGRLLCAERRRSPDGCRFEIANLDRRSKFRICSCRSRTFLHKMIHSVLLWKPF